MAKNNFLTPYVLNHNSNTIFCSWNCLDLVSLTKRNIAMMSKPKKTCWVKKAGGKLKRKKANYHHQSFYTASHFTSYIFSCVVYRCAFFVDELCCEGYHQIRHLYIREQHINNPHKILFCILYFENYKQVPYKYTNYCQFHKRYYYPIFFIFKYTTDVSKST